METWSRQPLISLQDPSANVRFFNYSDAMFGQQIISGISRPSKEVFTIPVWRTGRAALGCKNVRTWVSDLQHEDHGQSLNLKDVHARQWTCRQALRPAGSAGEYRNKKQRRRDETCRTRSRDVTVSLCVTSLTSLDRNSSFVTRATNVDHRALGLQSFKFMSMKDIFVQNIQNITDVSALDIYASFSFLNKSFYRRLRPIELWVYDYQNSLFYRVSLRLILSGRCISPFFFLW